MTIIEDFENEFKKFTDSKYAIAVSSGTSALHIALLSVGIKEGDKVITTPFTHISTVNSILYCKAKPIFADIRQDTYCIDAYNVETKIKENPDVKAILCVHLFGNVCDMFKLTELASKYNLKLIEDCAQAFGVKDNFLNTHVGNFGDLGTFSFYASKNLWTFEGGMVVTNDKKLAKMARLLRAHGEEKKYYHTVLGYNYRMPQICALVGLTALKLHKRGILSEIGSYGIDEGHYPVVVYEQPLYKSLNITGRCPTAESVAKKARLNFERQHGRWGK